jgi:hypothetical protein
LSCFDSRTARRASLDEFRRAVIEEIHAHAKQARSVEMGCH